jgi:AcrR family transcriptional regulator
LIQIGLELLSTRRLDEISVDEIASHAGISSGLLFHYFTTKRDYQMAVTRAAAEQMLAATAPDPDAKPTDKLRQALTAFVDFVQRYPKLYGTLLRGPGGADEELTEIRRKARDRLIGWVEADLPVGSPLMRQSIRSWMAFVDEATADWLRIPVVDRDTLVQFLFEAFIKIEELAYETDLAFEARRAKPARRAKHAKSTTSAKRVPSATQATPAKRATPVKRVQPAAPAKEADPPTTAQSRTTRRSNAG